MQESKLKVITKYCIVGLAGALIGALAGRGLVENTKYPSATQPATIPEKLFPSSSYSEEEIKSRQIRYEVYGAGIGGALFLGLMYAKRNFREKISA